jgi:hypothetical protein
MMTLSHFRFHKTVEKKRQINCRRACSCLRYVLVKRTMKKHSQQESMKTVDHEKSMKSTRKKYARELRTIESVPCPPRHRLTIKDLFGSSGSLSSICLVCSSSSQCLPLS